MPSNGKAEILVMELVNGIDYIKMQHFLTAMGSKHKASGPTERNYARNSHDQGVVCLQNPSLTMGYNSWYMQVCFEGITSTSSK